MKTKPYIIAFLFFIVDLISKQLISHIMNIGDSIKVINNFFYITYAHNKGAAWSILEDKQIIILMASVMALFLINKYMNQEKLTKLENLSYGMLIGGILGNLFDRICYGYVIDFFDFKLFGYNYPIFNLADTFIVVGIVIMVIIIIRKDHYERSNSRRK